MWTVDILRLQKEIHEKARKISVLCTSNLTTKIARKSRSLALTFSKKNSLNDDIQLDFEIELMHGNGNGL